MPPTPAPPAGSMTSCSPRPRSPRSARSPASPTDPTQPGSRRPAPPPANCPPSRPRPAPGPATGRARNNGTLTSSTRRRRPADPPQVSISGLPPPVPLQKCRDRSDLGVSVSRLRGAVVLVDHAAKHLATLHRRVKRHDDRLVLAGWPLLPGLMRSVPVIVPGVGPQDHPQVGFAARRIRRTVASLTWWPRRINSPCTRRYRQAGFSRAIRSTRSRISWPADGRPGRPG